jgi:hypothetical protein
MAARWSYIDLNSAGIAGGYMDEVTLGLNWYLNPFTLISFNYVRPILRDPVEGKSTADMYYWYYATQVMFYMGGEYWERWNRSLRPLIVDHQVQEGPLAGIVVTDTIPLNDGAPGIGEQVEQEGQRDAVVPVERTRQHDGRSPPTMTMCLCSPTLR